MKMTEAIYCLAFLTKRATRQGKLSEKRPRD